MMVNPVELRICRPLFSRIHVTMVAAAATALLSALSPALQAQQVAPPAGSQAEQKRLMEIRSAALQGRGTTPQQPNLSNHDIVLNRARQDKEFKRRAALAVKQQQSIDAYREVKQSQIDSWKGKGKSNKISSGVPADFTTSLPPLDDGSRKKKGLFSGVVSAPGKALKSISSLRPGFFSKKKKRASEGDAFTTQFAPPQNLGLDGVVPNYPEPAITAADQPEPAPAEQVKKKGFRLPTFGSLTGGKKKNENPYAYEDSNTEGASPAEPDSSPQVGGDLPEKKKSFFSRLPLIGNKNKDLSDNADQYYGPSGEGEDSGNEEEWLATDAPQEENKPGFLSKFSLKKGNKNKPKHSAKGESAATRNIYVIDSDSEFFPFGKSHKQAGTQSLREGTVVRMTKSGDDWSSIELPSGAMGVMRNKHLRLAKADEVPSNLFTKKVKKAFPTTARISKTRSATGKKTAAPPRYSEPVTVPLPDLPEGGTEPGELIGNGLLPPLQKPSSIQ